MLRATNPWRTRTSRTNRQLDQQESNKANATRRRPRLFVEPPRAPSVVIALLICLAVVCRTVHLNGMQTMSNVQQSDQLAIYQPVPAGPPPLVFRDLEQPKVFAAGKKCAIFSCSEPGYFLLNASYEWHHRTLPHQCDRIFFFGNVYKRNKPEEKLYTGWCRAALLSSGRLDHYKTIAQVDVDAVYNETILLDMAKKYSQQDMVVNYKHERLKGEARTTIRVSTFLLPDFSRVRGKKMMLQWSHNWAPTIKSGLNDQPVFNELFNCDSVGIQCLTRYELGEAAHCGRYLRSAQSRYDCLRLGTDWKRFQ
mmetsp:Transcript_19585/g.53922  ORF Transcript_19585/g.53922 Transcript_19585/m.53922 type:complete len:309 (-) Transcript_19585:1374-2300(-)